MLTLPPISICCGAWRFVFALPCPATDLIGLATLLGRPNRSAISAATDNPIESLQRLILSNPALLLYCAATYQNRVGCRFQSLVQLIQWIQTNLLDSFDEAPRGWSLWTDAAKSPISVPGSPGDLPGTTRFQYHGQPILKRYLKRFLLRQRNRGSNKVLARFLMAATECSADIAGDCIGELFGNFLSICGRQTFGQRKHRNQRRLIYDLWRQTTTVPFDVEAVFGLLRQIAEAHTEFDKRLWQAKMAAVKQLAYGASHEINNPLANIASRAQTLLPGESNPERQHKLGVIYEQALRAHEMISDLMLFANPPELVPVSIDLRPWLSNLIRELEPSLRIPSAATNGAVVAQGDPHRIELQIRLGPGLQQIKGDPQHLGVALKMLLRNSIESIRSTSNAKRIELRVFHRNDGWICFSITDDGAGISPAIREHMFDPFFSGREAGRGLGFGLPKAWRIAELHGGRLVFDQRFEPGARFELQIPVAIC